MRPTTVRYLIRKRLGEYEHEELEVTMEPTPGSEEKPEELLAMAKKTCVTMTTEYRTQQARKAAQKAQGEQK